MTANRVIFPHLGAQDIAGKSAFGLAVLYWMTVMASAFFSSVKTENSLHFKIALIEVSSFFSEVCMLVCLFLNPCVCVCVPSLDTGTQWTRWNDALCGSSRFPCDMDNLIPPTEGRLCSVSKCTCVILTLPSQTAPLPFQTALLAQWLRCPPREQQVQGLIPACAMGLFPGQVIPVTLELVLQWLPCQAPGITGSALGLVAPASIYCDWVRYKVWSATLIQCGSTYNCLSRSIT